MDAQVDNLAGLTAAEAARRIKEGQITSQMLVEACLERIAERDETVQAWEHLDTEYAMEQARRADDYRATGQTTGPLHGVPVGIKDIIDTRDYPTENGTPAHAGRQPREDAAVVSALKDAGAIVLGKTVTTELAVFHPNRTRNPVNPEHTPGGSSSGSAAAVADGMVPVALGTQTGGSVIRPAAFCGVFGFKPTFGLISRTGVLMQSPPLDTLGVFTRSIEDAGLLADCLSAYDPRDAGMWPRSRPELKATALQEPPVTPMFAFVKGPSWDQAEKVTGEAFAELAEALGDHCDEVELPSVFNDALSWHKLIQTADVGRHYGPIMDKAPDKISDGLKEMIQDGRNKVLARDYNHAVDLREVLNAGLEEIFERYDAILTPAAPGPAPKGLKTTGSPAFNALWTYLGVPAITVPLLDAEGLPLGVQLVAPRRDDARLLRNASWLTHRLSEAQDDEDQ